MIITCNVCEEVITIPKLYSGIWIKCPKCGTVLMLYQ